MTIGIHIFRKDLRIVDNLSLYKCASTVDKVLGVFILDDIQTITPSSKFYRSYNAIRFMLESIEDLNKSINNNLWICDEKKLLKYIKSNDMVTTVSWSNDYTKYAVKRDSALKSKLESMNVKCITLDEQFMIPVEITKDDGLPYVVFSHFYKKAIRVKIDKPLRRTIKWVKPPASKSLVKLYRITNANASPRQIVHGGRTSALKTLLQSKKTPKDRNLIQISSGSMIAPYINFGCISSREVYLYWKQHRIPLMRELYWRDFFMTILKTTKMAREYKWLDPRYNKIKWRSKSEFIKEWDAFWNSKTGFHIVDAATKQLRETGYLPNRARIIWAWFCIKMLQIDPFDKKYGAITIFSRFLTDAMTSQNKMNFEWIISTLDTSGRRYARGPPLAGRYLEISNLSIKKYKAQEWIRYWLTDKELLAKPIFDANQRYKQWIQKIKAID